MAITPLSRETLEQLGISDPELDIQVVRAQVQKLYPDFTLEEVEAFLAYLAVKSKRSEVFKRLADS